MSVSRGGKAPRDAVVGQLIDLVGKEIARLVAPEGHLPNERKIPAGR
jgi:hypothetical protein